MLAQLLINGIITGCAYALVALGFAFIYNTTRIFHFAHGAVYTAAAYCFYLFYSVLDWPMIPAFLLTMGISSLLGVLIDEAIYTPLVKQGSSLLIQMLSSIALYIVIINFIAMVFGSDTKILIPEVQPTYHIGPIILTKIQIATVFIFLFLFCAVGLILNRTYWGKMIRAMRDNPILVSAMGINPQMVRRVVFGLGSSLASVSAILFSLDFGIDPHIGMVAFLNGAVAVIIGGVGLFEGAVLGSFVLGLFQSAAVWKISARWQDLITFVVLILFLLFRSEGILGKHHRTEEIKT